MPDPDAIAADLRLVIGQLARRVRNESTITPIGAQNVVGWLGRDGAATVSDLAALAHVRPQSMARTVAELTRAGLVEGRPHPTDRRKTLIDLTPAGRAALEDLRARRISWLAQGIAEELDPDEQQVLAQATALLARLAERPV